jgi:hypothetical protein
MFSIAFPFNFEAERVLWDDFDKLDTAATNGKWASVNDGATGTLALGNVGGLGDWISIPTAAADNDYQYLKSAGAPYLFDATRPCLFQARVSLTEAATTAANIVIGLSSVTSATVVGDDGAGVVNSFSGALFTKVDGGTVWQFATSNGTTQKKNASVVAFTSGTVYTLGFQYNPKDGVTGTVQPFVNGVLYAPHQIAVSGLAVMNAIVGVKAGGANAETLKVDYLFVKQPR